MLGSKIWILGNLRTFLKQEMKEKKIKLGIRMADMWEENRRRIMMTKLNGGKRSMMRTS